MLGGNYGPTGVMVPLDADGHLIEAIGEYGNIQLPRLPGTIAAVVTAIVALPGTPDVVAVTT